MVTRQRNTGKGRAEDGITGGMNEPSTSSSSSSSQLPLAIDAAMTLSSDELGVLQEQYIAEQDKGFVSTQTKFNMAWGLVRSDQDQQVKEGISLLMDIYESDPGRRRECLYYLALGHYKLKNYTESKKFTSRLLSKEPQNMQALSLNAMIDEDVRKEGLIGMAIAGGAIAVIGGITIAALKGLRSR